MAEQVSEPTKGKTLKQEILKIVIDKLLIAVLLVVAGYYSTVLVEKFKADISFSGELNKIRAEKIGETWEQVYRYEGVNDTLHAALSPENPDQQFLPNLAVEITVTGRNEADIERQLKKQQQIGIEWARKRIDELKTSSSALYPQVIDSANKNRFWLGENAYKQIVDYTRLLAEYNWRENKELEKERGYGPKNKARAEELKDQIAKARVGIDEIRTGLSKQRD